MLNKENTSDVRKIFFLSRLTQIENDENDDKKDDEGGDDVESHQDEGDDKNGN